MCPPLMSVEVLRWSQDKTGHQLFIKCLRKGLTLSNPYVHLH